MAPDVTGKVTNEQVRQSPSLTDGEMEIAVREGATDEEIQLKLRDLMLWSYIMRDPLAKCVPSVRERGQMYRKCVRPCRRICVSVTSPYSKTRRRKPAPLTALGALCYGRHGLTQTLAFGQHRLMCSMMADPCTLLMRLLSS